MKHVIRWICCCISASPSGLNSHCCMAAPPWMRVELQCHPETQSSYWSQKIQTPHARVWTLQRMEGWWSLHSLVRTKQTRPGAACWPRCIPSSVLFLSRLLVLPHQPLLFLLPCRNQSLGLLVLLPCQNRSPGLSALPLVDARRTYWTAGHHRQDGKWSRRGRSPGTQSLAGVRCRSNPC